MIIQYNKHEKKNFERLEKEILRLMQSIKAELQNIQKDLRIK